MGMIERLLELDDSLCAAVLETGPASPLPGGWAWSPYRSWYSAQPRFSIYERFPHLPKIDCQIGAQNRAKTPLAALNLDFCLQTTPLPPGVDLAGVTRFGVWTLFYGQNGNPYGGIPPAFAELERGDPHIPVSLERLGERPGTPRQILRQGVVNGVPRSYRETLDNAMTAGIDLPALVVRQLRKSGTLPAIGTHAPVPTPPSTGQIAGVLLGLGWPGSGINGSRRSVPRCGMSESSTCRSRHFWTAGILLRSIGSLRRVPGNFWRIPLPLKLQEGFQLLTEGFDYDRYQGYITSAFYRPGVPLSEDRVVIDEGVHMSYPFPLLYQGRQYCIPECQTRREVALYHVEQGSNRWIRRDPDPELRGS